MKRARAVIVSLLFVLLGAGVLAYSQQEQQDDKKPKSEKQTKPDQRQQPFRRILVNQDFFRRVADRAAGITGLGIDTNLADFLLHVRGG